MPAAIEIPQSLLLQGEFTSVHKDAWLKTDVFQVRRWILIAMLVGSAILRFVLLDIKRAKEARLFAAPALILTLAVREYGEELVLRDFPTDIRKA